MMVTLQPDDLDQLAAWFPELRFADAERRAVLLESGNIDIQAAPGSGKTTLLGAKLSLIAARWPHTRRGVCVLSHTNVARTEIEAKLRRTPSGTGLLNYPHFVGTIQSFVHQHLALPLLRSLKARIEIVDDDAFAAKALASASHNGQLKSWMNHSERASVAIIQGLRYEGSELALGSAGGALPSTGSERFRHLERLKAQLLSWGYMRYDDMYAFAAYLLKNWPGMRAALSYRFPLVLVDEMQDTSGLQEHLLTNVFDETVAVQRLGDVNQNLLHEPAGGAPKTFPKTGHLTLSASLRFCPAIAAVANRLKWSGMDVSADVRQTVAKPTMLLFDDGSITGVLNRFGALVVEQFSPDELVPGSVKALCQRKTPGGPKHETGRHLADYWPAYDGRTGRPPAARHTALEAARAAHMSSSHARSAAPYVAEARAVVLMALRKGGAPVAADVRTWRELVTQVETTGLNPAPLHDLIRVLVFGNALTLGESNWDGLVHMMFDTLQSFWPPTANASAFASLPEMAYESSAPLISAVRNDANVCSVIVNAASVDIHLSTIAGAKGETHLATLVLESYRKPSYDLQAAIPYLCGEKQSNGTEQDVLHSQLRNLFVAMTRPKQLLCAAMHADHLPDKYQQRLTDIGWEVLRV